jgi:hypothetical protein
MGARAILFWLVSAAVAAASGPSPTPRPAAVPEGSWGGAGIRVEVAAHGARVEIDAAHGQTAGPLALDAEGRFDVAGTLARERPGPVRPADLEGKGDPVRYRGSLEGDTLTLEILPGAGKGEVLGPLKAVRGAPPRLRKML